MARRPDWNNRGADDRNARGGQRGRKRPGGGKSDRPGRRTPPPEDTGEEKRFWEHCIDSGEELVFHLEDGQEFASRLTVAHRESLETENDDSSTRLIPKDRIRYIEC